MRLEYFQMIDRFVAVDVGERTARATCTIPQESPVFEGHFPGYPLMPGVLLVECMAQTAGWLVNGLNGFVGLPVLAGVKNAKIRTAVYPGQTLELEGHVIHEGSGYAVAKAKGWMAEGPVCDAELTYRIVKVPSPVFHERLVEWAKRIEFPIEAFEKVPTKELGT